MCIKLSIKTDIFPWAKEGEEYLKLLKTLLNISLAVIWCLWANIHSNSS